MGRTFSYDILPLIKTRWSSRALSNEKISRDDILALIEAARYAPSCYNEQPWRFVIADTAESLNRIISSLADLNKSWAAKAPVIIAICAKKTFSMNGVENFWRQFDTGTAWGYLSLEAERRGIVTHGMAGFDRNSAAKVLSIPDDYEVIAIVAAGKPGNPDSLSEDLKSREAPGTRKDISDIYSFGKFGEK